MKNRRDFIKKTAGASAMLCCGVSALSFLQSCTGSKYISTKVVDGRVSVLKTEFSENVYLVVSTDKLPYPIYLYKNKEGEYSAFLMLCTHTNCELSATSKSLICPCHGSEFSVKGEVTQGPAERDLKSFVCKQTENEIIIELKNNNNE